MDDLGMKVNVFLPTALAFTGIDMLIHAPLPIEVAGIVGALMLANKSPEIYNAIREHIPALPEKVVKEKTDWTFTDRLMGKHYHGPYQPTTADSNGDTTVLVSTCEQIVDSVASPQDSLSDEDMLFAPPQVDESSAITRVSVEQIVKHIEPNSYRIYIGRSLTKDGNPAVSVNFYKQHFRFIGASQRGKSSMVAAFIDIVTRTHDKQHVLICILDREDRTGNLFNDLPHVPTLQIGGERIKMHARNEEQVLEYLTHLTAIMEERYKLSYEQLEAQPIILIYVEEFLLLKDHFKLKMETATSENKKQAETDYKTLMYCISQLSHRGLKVLMQLLLVAQVEYADEDFKQAMASISCGFSFCVRPTAAMAAGFQRQDLLRRNALEDKAGQAVVEMPDCKDLILAPEFDVAAKLRTYQKQQTQQQTPSNVLSYPVRETQDIPPLAPVVKPVHVVSLLERGINAYMEGATTQPALVKKLGITEWEARKLIPRIEAVLEERAASE